MPAPRRGAIRPAGSGRFAVRFISASMSASYHWLSAPAAPAPSAMHEDRDEADERMDVARRGQQPARRR